MNKKMGWVFGILSLVSSFAVAGSVDPRQVMIKSEEARKVRDVQSDAVLITADPRAGGAEKTKKFTWWRKLQADSTHYHTMTRFHFPPEVRGEGILFLERGGEDGNEVLLYLPTFKKIRRVENQQQSGSFMSSEFSYSDISTTHVDDYKYSLKSEEKERYIIVSEPANDSVRERTGYSKSILWIDKKNFMPTQIDHYDLKGDLIKHLNMSMTEEIDSKEHKWMSRHLKVTNIQTDRYTILSFENVKANRGIADSIFTQQNLQKER